jgi:hypothetical protein
MYDTGGLSIKGKVTKHYKSLVKLFTKGISNYLIDSNAWYVTWPKEMKSHNNLIYFLFD